jgi:hypothetical protein
MTIVTPTTQLLGPADRPHDYDMLTSGWALGAAFGNTWALGGQAIARGAEAGQAAMGRFVPDLGTGGGEWIAPESRLLEQDEAEEKYGIAGALTFTAPKYRNGVREDEARLLRQWKLEELDRNDRLARSTPGLLPGTARFLAGLTAGALDPLNLGTMAVPVLGEARWANIAMSLGARPARVLRGAAEGLAGGALTEPLVYMGARDQQADYDAGDAARDLFFGTLAGAGIHALGGEADDLLKRWRASPIEIRDAAVNQATAALVTGTPVRADAIMQAVTPPETLKAAALKVGDQVFTGPTHGDAYEKALAAGISEDAISKIDMNGFVTSTGRYVTREEALGVAQASGQKFRRVGNSVTSQGTTAPTIEEIRAAREARSTEKPKDAIAFIQSKGGVRDTEGHDLRSVLGQRQNPRYGALIRESGQSIDEIGEALHEAGFFGDPGVVPRPTEAEVVDFLREAAGRKVYAVQDTGAALDAARIDEGQARDMAAAELDRAAEEMGVNVSAEERAAALDAMMEAGVSASDALDHVLERASIEGGVFTSTAQRLADIEARLERAQEGGAPLHELAPLLDERAALQADLAAERLPAVGETIKADLRGDNPGSLDAAELEASRAAELDAKEAMTESESLRAAREAAESAKRLYEATTADEGALPREVPDSATSQGPSGPGARGSDEDIATVGSEDKSGSPRFQEQEDAALPPADRAELHAELERSQAKRQAAISLAGCMIREGV